jgi:hypothetical protein
VEIKTDNLNERAKQGLEKLVQRKKVYCAVICKCHWIEEEIPFFFSILKDEWPKIKNSIFKEITSFQYSE